MRPLSIQEGLGNWIALIKQWRMAAAVSSIGFVTSMAIIVCIKPIYKADVQLMLPVSSIEDPASRHSVSMQADPFVVRSYAEVIINDDISNRVIQDLALDKNEEFAEKPSPIGQLMDYVRKLLKIDDRSGTSLFSKEELRRSALLGNYEGRLKAVNDGRSLVVDLSFQAHDPRLAMKIVNAHAQTFVNQEIARYREAASNKTEWMKKELDRTEAEFLKTQESLQSGAGGTSLLQDRTGLGISALKMRESMARATVDVYGSVLKRYQDMLADAGYKSSDIKIVSLSILPTSPYFPKKALMAALAALIWVILGIGAAAIAALVRDRVTIDAWMATSGQNTLGRLHFPSWSRYAWLKLNKGTAKRLFWEEVREIQSTIKRSGRRRPVILVTSALPHEGKSLLASALAHGLAATGVRTLLVDIKARNSFYARTLDPLAQNSGGVEAVLAGKISVMQAAVQIGEKLPLYYLGSQDGDRALDLRASSTQVRSAFSAMRKAFAVIVIDTPAMESLSDALRLAEFADDVIVAALVQEDPQHLASCIEKLKMRSAKLQGIVITDKARLSAERYAKIARYQSDGNDIEIWPVRSKPNAMSLAGLWRMLSRTTKSEEHLRPQAKLG